MTTRLSRLVRVARRREDQARQVVAAARADERVAVAQVDVAVDALRRPRPAPADFRFARALDHLGCEAISRAEGRAVDAARALDVTITAWQAASQRLGTMERLEERLQDLQAAEFRRRLQREADDLATTRAGQHP